MISYTQDEINEYLQNWDDNGYIVIRAAIDKVQVKHTVNAIFDFLEMDPFNPSGWYDEDIRSHSGIDKMGRIPFYHHQTLWDNRQNPLIHAIYHHLYDGDELLVSIDRVNMNPPVTNAPSVRIVVTPIEITNDKMGTDRETNFTRT